MKLSNTQEFIEKARKVHGDKYDYSKVNYIKSNIKVTIICPIHGEFLVKPNNHLNGQECLKCSYIKRANKNSSNTQEFIEKARKVHGDKYDYSMTEYHEQNDEVTIVCPEHGIFKRTAKSHLRGNGCPSCIRENNLKRQKQKFIEKASLKFGNKFDYSKVVYKGTHTNVTIICPIHGEIQQTPSNHLHSKYGCQKCAGNNPLSKDDFIKKACSKHGDKYDYSLVDYRGIDKPIDIICPIHGKFTTTPYIHLYCSECPKCSHRSYKYTTEEWVKEAKEKHGDKYDYSKVKYVDSKTPVTIICPKHGDFPQNPHSHLRGSGCKECIQWKLETAIENLLLKNNITFNKHKNFDFLQTYNVSQSLDFYLPDYNIGIECQGEQHFNVVEYFGGEEGFKTQKERDERKYNLCQQNGIHMIYYTENNVIKNVESVIDNKIYFKENIYINKHELIKYVKDNYK